MRKILLVILLLCSLNIFGGRFMELPWDLRLTYIPRNCGVAYKCFLDKFGEEAYDRIFEAYQEGLKKGRDKRFLPFILIHYTPDTMYIYAADKHLDKLLEDSNYSENFIKAIQHSKYTIYGSRESPNEALRNTITIRFEFPTKIDSVSNKLVIDYDSLRRFIQKPIDRGLYDPWEIYGK